MTKHSMGLIMRVPDPFDGSAEARLAHMGLLDQEGRVVPQSMKVFTRIFAGLFFDDLCDFYDDRDKLETIYHTFRELAEKGDHQHMLLARIIFTVQPDGDVLFLAPFIKSHRRNTMQALDASLKMLSQLDDGSCSTQELTINTLMEVRK